jgi:hypothetical protein
VQSRNLWLNLEHLKHLFANKESSILQISHPRLTFFCSNSFLVWAPTSITKFRICFFVMWLNLALTSPFFKLRSGDQNGFSEAFVSFYLSGQNFFTFTTGSRHISQGCEGTYPLPECRSRFMKHDVLFSHGEEC